MSPCCSNYNNNSFTFLCPFNHQGMCITCAYPYLTHLTLQLFSEIHCRTCPFCFQTSDFDCYNFKNVEKLSVYKSFLESINESNDKNNSEKFMKRLNPFLHVLSSQYNNFGLNYDIEKVIHLFEKVKKIIS